MGMGDVIQVKKESIMKERFEARTIDGTIEVACKYDDGNIRYWTANKKTVIAQIVDIVNEYAADGYKLTLRQLHYQFVTNNWIVNHDSAYSKLGSILDDCRYSGLIDWNAIEDRGRVPHIHFEADDLADGLTTLKRQYRINRQAGQEVYLELWSEKDALSGILGRSTNKYHIHLVINKGYTSSSAVYAAYQRILKFILDGIKVKILYFGDHDPSGLDMIRDIRERLFFFLTHGGKLNEIEYFKKVKKHGEDMGYETLGDFLDAGYGYQEMYHLFKEKVNKETPKFKKITDDFHAMRLKRYLVDNDLFEVVPIGLTMEQINEYNLPHNPAKVTDPRAKDYIKKFGSISWEVDALKAHVLTSIVESHVEQYIDMDLYKEKIAEETGDLDQLDEYIVMSGGEPSDDDRNVDEFTED